MEEPSKALVYVLPGEQEGAGRRHCESQASSGSFLLDSLHKATPVKIHSSFLCALPSNSEGHIVL